LLLCALWLGSAATSAAQDDASAGIPIDDATVRQACGSCHASDEAGRMSRISYRRTTPEGWQQTIRRMVTLNDVPLDPATARDVVRYLSNHLGLAPEEAVPVRWEAERRADDQPYEDADIQETCTTCHSLGRVLSQRRTPEEWQLVTDMHRGYYPFVDFQAFGVPGEEPAAVDVAVEHFSERLPLETADWSAWSATMRPARLAGTWALRGHSPGDGPVYGEMTVTPVAGTDDEFTTETRYVYAADGREVRRSGRAIVYTGFQWRGRSTTGPEDEQGLREVLFVERD